VAWGIVDVTSIAFPELLTDTFLVNHICVLNTYVTVASVWSEAVGWLIVIIATSSMAWSVVGVTVIALIPILTLTCTIEVTLRVVVTLQTSFTGRVGASISVITYWMASIHVESDRAIVSGPVGVTNTSVVVVTMGMWNTLDTVSSVWSNTGTVTKSVASSLIDIGSTIGSAPVGFTLAVAVEIFEGMWFTLKTVLRSWSGTSNTNWIARTLVDEVCAVVALVLEVACTLSPLIFGGVFDAEVTIGIKWA
jgi:hypothetical protein